jgi:hypothetical protein
VSERTARSQSATARPPRYLPTRLVLPIGVAATALVLLLTLGPRRDLEVPTRLDGARSAGGLLLGHGGRADFAADYVGARALLARHDPYPSLGAAFDKVGIDWNVADRSTHPPTADVLALPVAKFSWPVAAAIWGWAMIFAIATGLWGLGVPPAWAAAAAPLAVLCWPPAGWSIGQIAPLWLLGAGLSWRWRQRPFLAGLAIGLAALTKLLPALLLLPFLGRRQWKALIGFAFAVVCATVPLLVLYPRSIARFVEVQRDEGSKQLHRLDNGSLVPAAWHHGGPAAALAAVLLVLVVAGLVAREILTSRGSGARVQAGCVWLSVALVPVAWIYTLLPLVTGFLASKRLLSASAFLTFGGVIVLPAAIHPFGTASAVWISLSIAIAGIGLIATELDEGAPPLRRVLLIVTRRTRDSV